MELGRTAMIQPTSDADCPEMDEEQLSKYRAVSLKLSWKGLPLGAQIRCSIMMNRFLYASALLWSPFHHVTPSRCPPWLNPSSVQFRGLCPFLNAAAALPGK